MSSSRSPSCRVALALVATLAVAEPAHGAACCVGATTTLPTRLGKCENASAGVSVAGRADVARWDSAGKIRSSSMRDQGMTWTLLGAYRWDRKGQVVVSVPFLLNHRASSSLEEWSGGLGDITVGALFEPLEEGFVDGRPGAPVPVLQVAVRAPSGRAWRQSTTELGADITGRPGTQLTAMLSVERTSNKVPWTAGVGTAVEIGPDGVRPSLVLQSTVGGTFGAHWSLSGGLTHRETWSRGGAKWFRTAQTTAGLQAAYGVYRTLRVWGGVSGDLPIPHFGADTAVQVGGTAGIAWLF